MYNDRLKHRINWYFLILNYWLKYAGCLINVLGAISFTRQSYDMGNLIFEQQAVSTLFTHPRPVCVCVCVFFYPNGPATMHYVTGRDPAVTLPPNGFFL